MTTLSIIGAGHMGSAIAGLASTAGHDVQIIAPELDEARSVAESIGGSAGVPGDALSGDIVVLAVPHTAVDQVLGQYGSELAGKTVVDITNTLDSSSDTGVAVPLDSSSAQLIAERLPESTVLKAFNTTFAGTLASGQVGSVPTTVLVAGDDEDAKQTLLSLVTDAGLQAIDAGPLVRARELEAVGILQITLASAGAFGWTQGFAIVT